VNSEPFAARPTSSAASCHSEWWQKLPADGSQDVTGAAGSAGVRSEDRCRPSGTTGRSLPQRQVPRRLPTRSGCRRMLDRREATAAVGPVVLRERWQRLVRAAGQWQKPLFVGQGRLARRSPGAGPTIRSLELVRRQAAADHSAAHRPGASAVPSPAGVGEAPVRAVRSRPPGPGPEPSGLPRSTFERKPVRQPG